MGEVSVQGALWRVAKMAMTSQQETQSKRLAALARKYRAALVSQEVSRKQYEAARDYADRVREEMYDAADRYWQDVNNE